MPGIDDCTPSYKASDLSGSINDPKKDVFTKSLMMSVGPDKSGNVSLEKAAAFIRESQESLNQFIDENGRKIEKFNMHKAIIDSVITAQEAADIHKMEGIALFSLSEENAGEADFILAAGLEKIIENCKSNSLPKQPKKP